MERRGARSVIESRARWFYGESHSERGVRIKQNVHDLGVLIFQGNVQRCLELHPPQVQFNAEFVLVSIFLTFWSLATVHVNGE